MIDGWSNVGKGNPIGLGLVEAAVCLSLAMEDRRPMRMGLAICARRERGYKLTRGHWE